MSSQSYRLPHKTAPARWVGAPQLRYVTLTQYSAEWNSTPHTHDCSEIFVVTSGHGEFKVGERTVPASVNDVVIVDTQVPHTECSQPENPLSYIVFGVEGMDDLSEGLGYTLIHLHGRQPQINTCLELLLQEAREQAEGWEAVCQDLMDIFLRWLLRRKEFSLNAASYPVGTKTNRECELVRRYIDNHFKENLRLDDLAALAHINKYYLSHAFQREFGTSPISYLISRRIQESRYLLTDTDHTLSQIAHILGFSSLSYFSQSFRRLEGLSPLDYRRQYRQRESEQGGAP